MARNASFRAPIFCINCPCFCGNQIDPAKILDYTRAHCGVENKLHLVLDVQFGEDYSRKSYLNAAENYSITMKVALNMLKNDTKTKASKAFKAKDSKPPETTTN